MKTTNNNLNLKNMKTVLVTIAIVFSSLISNVYANSGNNLNEQIHQTVKFENGSLNIEKDKAEFVRISFKINEDGQLEILEMNYSNEEIKTQVEKQLKEIKIYGIVDINEVFYYNFSFIKR